MDDNRYLEIVLERIRVSQSYRPKFGQGQSISFAQFQMLYGMDPFYGWFGLNHPLVYAAHRAAGGITSVYRQIGIGCELLFRQIVQDYLGLDETQSGWAYDVQTMYGRDRQLSLDGRIELADLASEAKQATISRWLQDAANYLQIAPEVANVLKGAVFEVRQGYKSKDAKRQNADLANAATAYSQGYLPVVMTLSTQIDTSVARRYEQAKWLVLQGHLSNSAVHSTYAFMDKVVGYDLAGFFQRHSAVLQATVADVLQALLAAEDG
jgi:hypothetical protein